MNFYLLKEKILSESYTHKNFSDLKVYKFLLLEILSGNEKIADSFMLSRYGGYTKKQLKTIKSQIQRNVIINQAKIKSLQKNFRKESNENTFIKLRG